MWMCIRHRGTVLTANAKAPENSTAVWLVLLLNGDWRGWWKWEMELFGLNSEILSQWLSWWPSLPTLKRWGFFLIKLGRKRFIHLCIQSTQICICMHFHTFTPMLMSEWNGWGAPISLPGCGGLASAGCKSPPQLLSHSSPQQDRGEKKDGKARR